MKQSRFTDEQIIGLLKQADAGMMQEVNILEILVLEPGTFYVMDRGYVDFARLFQMLHAGALLVTRVKSNKNAKRVYSAKVDRSNRIFCDKFFALN